MEQYPLRRSRAGSVRGQYGDLSQARRYLLSPIELDPPPQFTPFPVHPNIVRGVAVEGGKRGGEAFDEVFFCWILRRLYWEGYWLMDGAAGDVVFAEILTTPAGQSKGCG